MGDRSDIGEALAAVKAFGAGAALTARIADLETRLHGKTRDKAAALLTADHIDETALSGALTIKQLSAQIDVSIHALGILTSLPYVLKRGEVIESLSLGAGNTGRHHDLETDRQIAEFKFIQWRGGSESIRQNSVFIEIIDLRDLVPAFTNTTSNDQSRAAPKDPLSLAMDFETVARWR